MHARITRMHRIALLIAISIVTLRCSSASNAQLGAIVHAGIFRGEPAVGGEAYARYRRVGIALGHDYAEAPQTMNALYADVQYHHAFTHGDFWVGIGASALCFAQSDCDTPRTFSASYAPARFQRRMVVGVRYIDSFETDNRKDPLTGTAFVFTIGLRATSWRR